MDQIFYSKTIEEIENEYENWQANFASIYHYASKCNNYLLAYKTKACLVLYSEKLYFDIEAAAFIMELHVIKVFKSYDEACEQCLSIIDEMEYSSEVQTI